MRYENERQYRKETSLKNSTKTQNQWAKNKLNTSVEEPGINESGIEAKKKGF
ncbi:hypothetical protein SAMN02745163_00498 [Clostridium cavendishii DSM 21758]|uniref:Uncharacterized protein n=1 Tax=Clostridium cavendishii DSM 21758 TaxID=1121302 RepID=A0A1M6CMD3_9CLOT|nr:hypothetical protein [Clostridium cavendishii]SHI61944.1 hypothetical protein SAMN02745163_00498 [Clostridium cavendishii DSM 21758]